MLQPNRFFVFESVRVCAKKKKKTAVSFCLRLERQMFTKTVLIAIVLIGIGAQYPPGVPPRNLNNNYPNPNSQQQFMPPPPPPLPQHQQPAAGQQFYQQQQSGHGGNRQRSNTGPLFDEKFMEKEKDHISSHLNAEYDPKAMSHNEFLFAHFKIIDKDANTFADGLEIYKAIYHALGSNTTNYHKLANEIEAKTDEFLNYCGNKRWNNGYISFEDFKLCK